MAASNGCKQQADSHNWTFANGRRYASSELGHYYMPNDEPEIQRLNQQHWMFTEVRGGAICSAPLVKSDEMNILDLGCGTGIWCLQMAEDFPDAKIIGVDISAIQPKNKPPNVEWIVLDLESEWPFPENHFDLIHLCLVHGCVADWPSTLAKISRHLRPGGLIEHQELAMGTQYVLDEEGNPQDRSVLGDKAYARWPTLMVEAAEKRGRTLHLGPHLKTWQETAGFTEVSESVYPMAVGSWPDDPRQRAIGEQWLANALSGLDGFTTILFTKVLGWTVADTKKYIEECKSDLWDNRIRKMIDLHVVHGRKPLTQ